MRLASLMKSPVRPAINKDMTRCRNDGTPLINALTPERSVSSSRNARTWARECAAVHLAWGFGCTDEPNAEPKSRRMHVRG
jgi:hypothetical protein